jgi:hypothetical protein
MGSLCFVCPSSGRKVVTGVEVDPVSFESLRGEQLRCADCNELHDVAKIWAW